MTGRGSFRAGLGRVFGDRENPLNWAIPFGRVAGIRLRLHLLFILYALGTLLFAIPRDAAGFGHRALEVATLFVIVLLHEFGHCFTARAVGGEADEILMWPLGGLATVNPPDTWRANLLTTLGGPAVNVALILPFAGALLAMGHADAILFNPLKLSATLAGLDSWWAAALWWAHCVNLAILCFNLLPIYPLDGGRVLHAALWARRGRHAALETSLTVGLIGGAVLAVGGLAMSRSTVLGIGIFAAAVCWVERKRSRAPDELGDTAYSVALREQQEERRLAADRAATERARHAKETAELDRLLAKIAKEGMGSLSRAERAALERASESKRAAPPRG